MKQYSKGFGLIEIALLIAIIAILAVTLLPALKQFNKRSQYREVVDTAVPLTRLVEKCLGLERQVSACTTMDQLIPYGYSTSLVEANSVIDTITLTKENGHYYLIVTPASSNQIYPFINDSHTFIQIAEIIDRNGRPVIESWETGAKSGCKTAGLC